MIMRSATRLTSILVIEDNQELVTMLHRVLCEDGYAVRSARDGESGLASAIENEPDLIILDVGLPRRNGFEVVQELRRKGMNAPMLMLTARSGVADRVYGLNIGADDYLIKPFSFTELVLRIRTLLRRPAAREPDAYSVADLNLDVLRRRVTRQDQTIALTNKEFMLLQLLMRREGEVLSRTMIASQVWDMNFDSDTNVIEVAIRRLRAKIDDDFDTKMIQTARGMGYMLDAPDKE